METKPKTRVFILVNTLSVIQAPIYGNHVPFFVYTAKNRPDIEFRFWNPYRMAIDTARNTAARLAQQMDCTHLMFLDDDVMIPEDALINLLDSDKDIIAGLVIIRGMPFNVMAFKFEDEAKKKLEFLNDIPLVQDCEKGHKTFVLKCDSCLKTPLQRLVQCDAIGFSCALIKMDVLQAVTPPYFLTASNHTEDIYFCMKIRNLDPVPEVWLNTNIRCGHLLNPEPIEWDIRDKMIAHYGGFDAAKPEEFIRDASYMEMCIAQVKRQQPLAVKEEVNV